MTEIQVRLQPLYSEFYFCCSPKCLQALNLLQKKFYYQDITLIHLWLLDLKVCLELFTMLFFSQFSNMFIVQVILYAIRDYWKIHHKLFNNQLIFHRLWFIHFLSFYQLLFSTLQVLLLQNMLVLLKDQLQIHAEHQLYGPSHSLLVGKTFFHGNFQDSYFLLWVLQFLMKFGLFQLNL